MENKLFLDWTSDHLRKKDFFISLMIGSTGAGKTSMTKFIVKEMKKDFDLCYLFLGSAAGISNSYTDIVNVENIIFANPETDGPVLSDMLTKLRESLSKINMRIQNDNLSKKTPVPLIRTLLIFDDFNTRLDFLINFVSVCRHSQISCLILTHNVTCPKPPLRTACNYIINNVKNTTFKEDLITKEDISFFKQKSNVLLTSGQGSSPDDENHMEKAYIFMSKDDPSKAYWKCLSVEEIKNPKDLKFYFWSRANYDLKKTLTEIGEYYKNNPNAE